MSCGEEALLAVSMFEATLADEVRTSGTSVF